MDQDEIGRTLMRRFHDNLSVGQELQVNRLPSVHANQPFRPLPRPTGMPPYHLALADVLQPAQMRTITNAGRLVFHMVGDTGGIKMPLPQLNVARQMEHDFEAADAAARPAFFYHLGDVVYFYGAAEEYYPQFYEPYMRYPAPIFAIPGNHDGDLSPAMEAQGIHSLDAFVSNFCRRIPHHTREALDVSRHAMTQPNVYWTLETPLVTIIGLYTNVPEGGRLDDDQIAWLETELAHAPTDRALLVTAHHPIYSLDDFHSGSVYLGDVLNQAMERAKRIPDAVFAGHVHNYQRFTRPLEGRSVPYIVAGAGGYHNLHHVSKKLQAFPQQPPFAVPGSEKVTLETYCDNRFGYLRLEISRETLKGDYFAVAGFRDPLEGQASHFDSFSLDLKTHQVSTVPLQGDAAKPS
jgi:hypothetical protein